MTEIRSDFQEMRIVGRFVDAEFDEYGDLDAVKAEIEVLSGTREVSNTASLRTVKNGVSVSAKPYADREENTVINPEGFPTTVTFEDVKTPFGAEGQELQLLFGNTVVAQVGREELQKIADESGNRSKDVTVEDRVRKLERLQREKRRKSNEPTEKRAEETVKAVEEDNDKSGGLVNSFLAFLSKYFTRGN